MSLSGYFLINGYYSPVGVTAFMLEKHQPKILASNLTYENVIIDDEGWVRNLHYPVSQADLDALCQRLPRFCNSMGELYLMPTEFHTVANEKQCDCH